VQLGAAEQLTVLILDAYVFTAWNVRSAFTSDVDTLIASAKDCVMLVIAAVATTAVVEAEEVAK
jgi:hypothetical protein